MKRKLFTVLVGVLVAFFIFGCATAEDMVKDKTGGEAEGVAANITIEGPTEVAVGETVTLTASAYDENMESIKANPSWSVGDTDIATIDKEQGPEVTVTGVSAGMAYITAEQDDASIQTMVQVQE